MASALRENTQKLTPPSTTLAPSGKVRPGETVMARPRSSGGSGPWAAKTSTMAIRASAKV